MKNIKILILIFLSINLSKAQTYCLAFSNPSVNGITFSIDISLSSNGGNFGLGSSNFVFRYNSSTLSNPTLGMHGLDMTNDYRVNGGGVTNPGGNASYNIELRNENNGDMVMADGIYLATINFTIINPNGSLGLEWLPQTVVYNHDESTIMTITNLGCYTTLNSPLPITLSSFSATKHSDRASKLDWTTSSEINSAYFGIERSRDGDDWETITKVNAAGNSNEELAYKYIDDQLPFTRSKDNIFYYRIRLTDQDGTHKYSDIKGVNFSREVADGLVSIYPNPATQMVHLDVSGLELDNVETKLNIFDMYGRSMLQKAITGSGLEPIDVQNYPAGVYNISVAQGDKLHQKQFIKID